MAKEKPNTMTDEEMEALREEITRSTPPGVRPDAWLLPVAEQTEAELRYFTECARGRMNDHQPE